MSETVYVAGVGIISAIGNNVTETLASFERGQAGMVRARGGPVGGEAEAPVREGEPVQEMRGAEIALRVDPAALA